MLIITPDRSSLQACKQDIENGIRLNACIRKDHVCFKKLRVSITAANISWQT